MPSIFLFFTLGSLLPSFPLPGSKFPANVLGSPLPTSLQQNNPGLFGLHTTSAYCYTTAQSLQINICRFVSTDLLTISLQKRRGVNILCSTKELSTNSEKGRNIQRHPPFLSCCIWFLSCSSLNVCPPLQKPKAKAWLLSALLANEVRNLPLSPPGN